MARSGGTLRNVALALGLAAATFGGLWLAERALAPDPGAADLLPPPPAPAPIPATAPPAPAPPASPEAPARLIRPMDIALAGDARTGRPRPAPVPGREPPAPPPDTEPPPLAILEPAARAFLTRRPVVVRVRSEPSARVTAGGEPLREGAAGVFAGELDLNPGAQEIRFTAVDAAGNRRQATLRVTVVALERLQGNRKRFQGLLHKLEELRDLAGELDHRIGGLLRDVQTAPPETIESLSAELRYVYRTREALEAEVERAIRELEASLPGPEPAPQPAGASRVR